MSKVQLFLIDMIGSFVTKSPRQILLENCHPSFIVDGHGPDGHQTAYTIDSPWPQHCITGTNDI